MCPTDDEHFYFGPDILLDPPSPNVFLHHNQLQLRTGLPYTYDKVVSLNQTDQSSL